MLTRRSLLEAARVDRVLTQEAVARRSGTSQPTLSAYERGTKAPTLPVVERILHSLGYDLGLSDRVTFREVQGVRGQFLVPDRLWRVDPPDCFAPLIVRNRRGERLTFDLTDRASRIAAYAWLLRHGNEEQLVAHLDGALLVDAWPDIPNRPDHVRREWGPVVCDARDGWFVESLRQGMEQRPVPVSPRARARAVRRLADHGLTADEIRKVLNRRR